MSALNQLPGRVSGRLARVADIARGITRLAANSRPVRANSLHVPLTLLDRVYVAGVFLVLGASLLTWSFGE